MLECCISGGCAGLGNLYILTVVVVVIDESNTSDDIRVDFGFQEERKYEFFFEKMQFCWK